jgi:hypothetical protein
MGLLSVGPGLKVPRIAPMAREREATVRRGRSLAKGVAG